MASMRAGCVICGDLYVSSDDVSAIHCGHTFHTVCIMQWLESGPSPSCPQCRFKLRGKKLVKLYFDIIGSEEADPDTLQYQVDNLKFQVRCKEQEQLNLKGENETLNTQVKGLRSECKELTEQLKTKEVNISAMKSQLNLMETLRNEAQKAREDQHRIKTKLKTLESLKAILDGSSDEAEATLSSYGQSADRSQALATACVVLKKELNKVIESKKPLRDELATLQVMYKEVQHRLVQLQSKLEHKEKLIENLTDENKLFERDNRSLKKKVAALQEAILSPAGDIKTSALNRLIMESPAPNHLKRPRLSQDMDADFLLTPEIVKKSVRRDDPASLQAGNGQENQLPPLPSGSQLSQGHESASSQDESPYLQVKSASIQLQLGLAASKHSVPAVRPSSSSFTDSKHSIFLKSKDARQAKHKANSGLGPYNRQTETNRQTTGFTGRATGYNGLGGHHKVDVFPKPSSSTLKHKDASIKVVNRSSAGRGTTTQSLKISNFFLNTFED